MMISLLLALYCPRLLVAIAKVVITVATHLLLAVLLWLPSCAAGTVSGDAPFAEELPPSSASLPPLPPLPSPMCVSTLAAAVAATAATAAAATFLISTCRHHHRRSRPKVNPMPACRCCRSSSDTLLPPSSPPPPSPPPMTAEEPEVEALAALNALPMVRAVKELPTRYGRQAGFEVTLWCRKAHHNAGAATVQLRQTQTRQTGVAVCQDLLKLVKERHSGHDCLEAATAACAAAAAAAAEPPPPTASPFATIQAGARVSKLSAAADAAFTTADAAFATAHAAAQKYEAAQAEALALEEEAELAREEARLPRKRQKAAAHEAGDGRYSLTMFRKLETEEQARRDVPVDRSRMDCSPLRDGESEGWRHHLRRGMHGALRSWAKGSLGTIVFMLAALTLDFNVVDEVSSLAERLLHSLLFTLPLTWQVACELKLKLSKEQFENAKTDEFMIDRVKSALHVLKQCDSEVRHLPPPAPTNVTPSTIAHLQFLPCPILRGAKGPAYILLAHAAAVARPDVQPSPPPLARTLWQASRVAYGTILAALAPPRDSGMIRKITGRLNVQRGTRSYKSAWYNGRFSRGNEPRPFDQAQPTATLYQISCNLPTISCHLPAIPTATLYQMSCYLLRPSIAVPKWTLPPLQLASSPLVLRPSPPRRGCHALWSQSTMHATLARSSLRARASRVCSPSLHWVLRLVARGCTALSRAFSPGRATSGPTRRPRRRAPRSRSSSKRRVPLPPQCATRLAASPSALKP